MVLLVREIMRREFLAVPPDRDVRRCVEEMAQRREGFLLVVEEGRTVGIATEWDFVAKVLAAGRDPATTLVGEIATRPVRFVPADAPTADVIEEMSQQGIRRMVVEEGGRTVGIVTAKDVLRAFRAYMDRISSDIAKMQSMQT
jgi:CBS domain-containing protein